MVASLALRSGEYQRDKPIAVCRHCADLGHYLVCHQVPAWSGARELVCSMAIFYCSSTGCDLAGCSRQIGGLAERAQSSCLIHDSGGSCYRCWSTTACRSKCIHGDESSWWSLSSVDGDKDDSEFFWHNGAFGYFFRRQSKN